MADELPQSGIILYQTEDGRTRVECRFEDETIWLTQALIAELFQKDVRTINEHLGNIFDEGELPREATIRKFRIVRPEGELVEAATCKESLQVRSEGGREVKRSPLDYDPSAIVAAGNCVRLLRGTGSRNPAKWHVLSNVMQRY